MWRQIGRRKSLCLGLHDQAAGLVEAGEAALVRGAEVARPVVPAEKALPGQRRAVQGRVVGADDRAGAAGRAVAGGRQPVDVQRAPAAPGQLERGARADDAGADDDRVVARAHGVLHPSRHNPSRLPAGSLCAIVPARGANRKGRRSEARPVPPENSGLLIQRTAMYIVGQEEIDAIAKVIREGSLFRYGVGGECERFEQRYADYLGTGHVALTCSGTYALTAAVIALGHRAGRRGAGAGPHLYGDRHGGAGGRRHPGDRRRRREHHDRSAGDRGCDRPAHQSGDPGAHVGGRLQHGRDHGDRGPARPAGARGHLPGHRRRLRGQEARHDRPCRRVQLQLLQEHDGRRRRGGLHRATPRIAERARSARSIPATSTGRGATTSRSRSPAMARAPRS